MTICDVPGVLVGHWTHPAGHTGCTAVLLPGGTTGGYALTGGAPASRETDFLAPHTLVREVHAFVLSGGSAYGLAAADGVMAVLEERGIGFPAAGSVVPIVPAACIFDLRPGAPRPDAAAGRAAALAASDAFAVGPVGAGAGATAGKLAGPDLAARAGLGTASGAAGDLVVGALAVANPLGDVVGEGGEVLAGSRAGAVPQWAPPSGPRGATVLAVVATNATFDKAGCTALARMAAAGIARAVRPSGTPYDGDIVFAAATCAVDAELAQAGALAADAVADAIRRSVVGGG